MKIYLAIPYTGMEEESFKMANAIAGQLMRQGSIVYSPISHSHPIANELKIPTDWEYWKDTDYEFIKWCDELIVIRMNGWKESKGVNQEIDIAKKLGKKIRYI